MLADPAPTPVTSPLLSTVATEVSLLLQELAGSGFPLQSTAVDEAQMVCPMGRVMGLGETPKLLSPQQYTQLSPQVAMETL